MAALACREQSPCVCTFSFRGDFGAIATPVDVEQIGRQPLGHRGDDVLAMVGSGRIVAGLAVFVGGWALGLVSFIEGIDSLLRDTGLMTQRRLDNLVERQ